MSAEQELLRRLAAALADAEIDVEQMVAAAWDDAQREVAETLRRLMVRDLLDRARHHLGGVEPEPEPRQQQPPRQQVYPPAAPRQRAAPVAPTHPPGEMEAEGATATYLYAITRGGSPLPADLPTLPGGGPVRAVDTAGLRAVVCDIDRGVLADLQEPTADGLETLTAAAHAHDTTLAACAQQADLLPLRLGTVVDDESAVPALLERHSAALAGELARIAGHAEWSVTVHMVDAPAEDEDSHDDSGGRAYLQARQASLQAREQWRETQRQLADEVHDRLARCAAAAHVISAKPMPEIAPPVLHGAYLVHTDQQPVFTAAVEDIRARHPEARVDMTGPWPPYHFSNVRIGQDTDTTT